MKAIYLKSDKKELDFSRAKQMAGDTASDQMEAPILLSWFDKPRIMESPYGVSDCHTECDIPGCVGYAQNRDGKLVFNIDEGDYLFCCRELGEFA